MTNRVLAREYFPEEILSLDLNDKRFVYELSVPTCSYRMGVERMGYGVLLLDSGKKDFTLGCRRFDACSSSDENGASGYSFHATAILLIVFLRCLRRICSSQSNHHFVVSSTNIATTIDLSLITRMNFHCSFVEIKSVQSSSLTWTSGAFSFLSIYVQDIFPCRSWEDDRDD